VSAISMTTPTELLIDRRKTARCLYCCRLI